MVTGSGGGCDIISDSADPEGLEIPEFTQKSVDAITPLLPDFANVRNPLDVTGFAMASRRRRDAERHGQDARTS